MNAWAQNWMAIVQYFKSPLQCIHGHVWSVEWGHLTSGGGQSQEELASESFRQSHQSNSLTQLGFIFLLTYVH